MRLTTRRYRFWRWLALMLWLGGVASALSPVILAQGEPTMTPNVNWVHVLEGINVRAGPGYGYGPVGALPVGAWVQPLARSADGEWILISYLYTQGWVQVEGVSWRLNTAALPVMAVLSPTPIPRPLYYSTPGGPTYTPNANWVDVGVEGGFVRAGPGQGYAVIGTVFTGDVVDPVAHDADVDWVMIRFGDGYGWIRYDLVAWVTPIESLPVVDEPNLTPSFTAVPARPSATRTPTATRTLSPTFSATPTETATASATPTATLVPTETATATWTASPMPSDTPVPTDTATIAPTDTPAPTATATPTATVTPSPLPTETSSPTSTASATFTATATPTVSPSPTNTPTDRPTETSTPLPTYTSSPSATPHTTFTATGTTLPTLQSGAEDVSPGLMVLPSPTETRVLPAAILSQTLPVPTDMPSVTPLPTDSPTPAPTATPSATASATPAPEVTPSHTWTATLTPTATLSATASATPSPSHTWTATPTPTATASRTPSATPLAVAAAEGPTAGGDAATTPLPPEPARSNVPPWLLAVAGALGAMLAIYVGAYVAGAANVVRYREGFPVTVCPICARGTLTVEDRRYRVFGIPRVRRVVRCSECWSVLRQVGRGRWRYAVDASENPAAYRALNNRVMTEPDLLAIAPELPPAYIEDDEA